MTNSPTSPKIWGKSFWTTFHIIALGYPDAPTPKDIMDYKLFYEHFGKTLPCRKCSRNYESHLIELPLNKVLSNKDTLFAWTVQFHNIVNRETHKSEWTVDYAREYYLSGTYNECSNIYESQQLKNDVWRLILIFMIILNIVIILYCYMTFLRK